ncbi:NAD(P)-binding domain protein [Niveomyces insectorum RCEF 264]|uniref:NAD(P)-binding domain protein n=1 Tax=Niveomyces insectorum RCEF 264 TaxID=1081102 RepID=A0A167P1U4_9HYPO|nr:NAD(P)-binding domain protein [Niveomyces insectorum RCEF 264]
MASTSLSLEATPTTSSFGAIFFGSQFLNFPKWPPRSTDLSRQVAVVTGATSGLGVEAARQLLDFHLSHLILAVRSVQRGEAVAASFRTAYPDATIEVWPLEMESYVSVQAFARRVDEELSHVDIVLLNAGIVNYDFERVEETGHEKVIQVDYLSTMLLAILLLPIIKKKRTAAKQGGGGRPARLTIVNSGVSLASKHEWEDMRPLLTVFDDTGLLAWNGAERYWSSKLLGQLFFIKLFPYVSADDVVFNMVDPGLVRDTGLSRNTRGASVFILWLMKRIAGRSLAAGASTYIDAAVIRGKESHGCFLMDWDIRAFAHFAYTPKGQNAMETLWKETLGEFKFANVDRILASLKN